MKNNDATMLRGWTLALSLAALLAGFLITNVNTFDVSLIYLTLFLVVIVAGLLTHIWGGLVASGIAVFSLVLLNQYVGIYPVQNRVVNIASELAIFLLAGPLAGWFSQVIEKHQAQVKHWIAVSEEQSTHENVFNTLKPDWSKARLEEEVARAAAYTRPLAVAVAQFTDTNSSIREERIAALQALIRIARSSTTVSAVVSYLGENRVLMILPEHTEEQTRDVLTSIRARAEAEKYFFAGGTGLGQPLKEFGELQMGAASLGSGNGSAESLLQRAMADLSSQGE